jgi:hypothetical protein
LGIGTNRRRIKNKKETNLIEQRKPGNVLTEELFNSFGR